MKTSLVSINHLAELTGLDRRKLKKTLRDVAPAKRQGPVELFRLQTALHALFAEAGKAAADAPEIQRKRAELLDVQTRRQELALGRERGELVPTDDVFAAFSVCLVRARREFLQLTDLAPALEGLPAPEVRAQLEKEIDKILTELASTNPNELLAQIVKEQGGETAS